MDRLLVVKNFIAGGLGQLIGNLLLFVIQIYLARALGPAVFGDLVFLIAFGVLIWFLCEAGLSGLIMRDVLKDGSSLKEKWPHFLGLSLLMASIAYLIFLALVAATAWRLVWAAALLGVSFFFFMPGLLAGSLFRAFEAQWWSALGFVAHKFFLLAGLWSLFHLEISLSHALAAYVSADGLLSFFYLAVARRLYGIALVPSFDARHVWSIFKRGIPLSLAQLFRRIAFQCELLIGHMLLGAASTGIFAIGFRVLQLCVQAVQVASTAFFPVMVRAQGGKKRFFGAFALGLAVLGGGAGAFLFFIAPYAPLVLGPRYVQSVSILKILAPALPFLFLQPLLFWSFVSAGREKAWSVIQGGVMIVAFVVAAISIRCFGAQYALAISKNLNEFLSIAVGLAAFFVML